MALFTLVDCLPRFERGPNKGFFKRITIGEDTVKKADAMFDKFLKGEYFPPLKF